MNRSTFETAIAAFRADVDTPVFVLGSSFVFLTIGLLVLSTEMVSDWFVGTNELPWGHVQLGYQLLILLLVGVVVILALSPWGGRRLGDENPEFGWVAYLAMLFSAGIASAIVFWGPAEALAHFESPPPLLAVDGTTDAAAVGAIQYSLFHWGISAWTAYVSIAVPIAYFAFNYGAPLRVSTVLTPYLGIDRLDGITATIVDVIAIGVAFGGLATTIGLVSQQFLTGVNYQFDIATGGLGILLFIVVVTLFLTASATIGIARGILPLSLLNVGLVGLFGLFVVVIGPTESIGNIGVTAVMGYTTEFVTMSSSTGITVGNQPWAMFSWAWWLSWAPVVGLFVARISRGRTIRQVIVAGIAVPTLATMSWFVIIGSTAIDFQRTGETDIVGVIDAFGGDPSVSIYPLLELFPYSTLLSMGVLVMIGTLLVTSADSGAYSLAMLTSTTSKEPTELNRAIWGCMLGIIATGVLFIGDLQAIQQVSILIGTPFGIVALLGTVTLLGHFIKYSIFVRPDQDELASESPDSDERDELVSDSPTTDEDEFVFGPSIVPDDRSTDNERDPTVPTHSDSPAVERSSSDAITIADSHAKPEPEPGPHPEPEPGPHSEPEAPSVQTRAAQSTTDISMESGDRETVMGDAHPAERQSASAPSVDPDSPFEVTAALDDNWRLTDSERSADTHGGADETANPERSKPSSATSGHEHTSPGFTFGVRPNQPTAGDDESTPTVDMAANRNPPVAEQASSSRDESETESAERGTVPSTETNNPSVPDSTVPESSSEQSPDDTSTATESAGATHRRSDVTCDTIEWIHPDESGFTFEHDVAESATDGSPSTVDDEPDDIVTDDVSSSTSDDDGSPETHISDS